uniref:Dishevelled n=1 Tax=Ditylenchus dipsaci TaxID=166011 RepID=A0A915EIQ6_9BILA
MDSSEASAEAITYATSQLQLNNGSREKTPQHQQPARPLHRRLDEEPTSAELVDEMRSEASSHGSQRSKSKSSQTTSTTNAGDSARQSTKVYYHIDDEQTPYCTERVLNRSNFKYYCKAIDQQVEGRPSKTTTIWSDYMFYFCREVKAEIRDDNQLLHKSSNGQFDAFSKPAVRHNMVPGPAPSSMYAMQNAYHHQRVNNHHNQFSFEPGHRNTRRLPGMHTPFEDSTIYTTESDGRIFSDDESRVSTSTDNITSVSRQHHNLYRRRRRQHHRRQPSRASSMSSMTETSMALEVITVTLNMDTVNFLGISIVGQSCSRGDNGIYVANVMPGGAVALDGRIEPGDMILQVNDISFENFTNDQAVDVLKDASIKLTVAKSFDGGRSNYFMVPSVNRGMIGVPPVTTGMNSIPEGSEGAPTPIPGQYPQQSVHFNGNQQQMAGPGGARPGSSSTTATSNGSGGGQTTIVGLEACSSPCLPNVSTSTLNTKRNRTWLKIPIPMSFLGSALIDWLMEHVDGLRDRKDGRKYASELLKEKLIAHVVNKITFTEQCYYVFGEECAEFVRLRTTSDEGSNASLVNTTQLRSSSNYNNSSN